MNIKKLILDSPFAKISKIIQAKILTMKMMHLDSTVIKDKTVYCISPYKTGTTFLSRCFDQKISKHEPIQYWSLLNLDKDFDKLFIKRLNYLNLKFECSGFLSYYVKELANNEITKDLEYICVLRKPSSWVSSVINFWNDPKRLEMSFDYINDHFWKLKVGVDLRNFQKMDDNKKQKLIEKLISFYFNFTQNTLLLKNVKYIKLEDLNLNLKSIESLIQEKSNEQNSWKRVGKIKDFSYQNEAIDKEYERITAGFIQEK